MVPQPDTIARQRYRALARQNDSSTLFAPLPARGLGNTSGAKSLVTYGKNSKPLSLTGAQFRNADPYDIPADDEAEDDGDAADATASAHAANREVRSRDSSPPSDCQFDEEVRQRDPRRDLSGRVKHGDSVATSGSGRAAAGSRRQLSSNSPHLTSDKQRVVKTKQNSERTKRKGPTSTTTTKRPPKTPSVRRLPVEELFLVTSPPQSPVVASPASSGPRILSQDPIQDVRGSSPEFSNRISRESRSKPPPNVIRKRPKTPASRFKSLRPIQRKRKKWPSYGGTSLSTPKSGDGFENDELRVSYPAEPRAYHKRKSRHAMTYVPLQLGSGPLPDVNFNVPGGELKLKLGGPELPVGRDQDHAASLLQPTSATQRPRRVVVSGDRDEMIMAQLSAVSAPARPPSESDDSEIEVEDEEAVSPELHSDIHEDESDHGADSVEDTTATDDEQADHSRQHSGHTNSMPPGGQARHSSTGVSLGSYAPATPRETRRQLWVKPQSIVLADGIEAFSDDIPLASDFLPPALPRPRSILKNRTPVFSTNNTTDSRPEATAANTRRNSTVEIDNESHYFTRAAHTLHAHPDPSKHRIVPRRHSSYFSNYPRIEVAGSERNVPETSPAQVPRYAPTSQVHGLSLGGKGIPTFPANLPVADLKALTRSISREYGTLSQSVVKRRPSLPFQLPTKIR